MNKKIKGETICIVLSVCSLIAFAIWLLLFLKDVGCIQREVFFGDSNDWFMDFFNPVYYSVGRSPYSWGELYHRNQMPTVYMFLYPFSRLFPYASEMVTSSNVAYTARYSQMLSAGVCIYLILSCAVLFYVLYKQLVRKEKTRILVLLSLFCSSIMLFAIERANTQIIASGILFVFFAYYKSDDKVKHNIALAALALSISLKIAFAFFGILLIYEKKLKDIIKVIAFFAAIFILSLLWLRGDDWQSLKNWLKAMLSVFNSAPTGWMGLNQDTIFSAFGIVWVKYILLAAGLIAGYFLHGWKRMLLLCLLVVETTFACAEYGLIILFYPAVLYLNEDHSPKELFFMICFVLLLSPLQYCFGNAIVTFTQRRVSNTICIVMLVVLMIEAVAALIKKYSVRPELCTKK